MKKRKSMHRVRVIVTASHPVAIGGSVCYRPGEIVMAPERVAVQRIARGLAKLSRWDELTERGRRYLRLLRKPGAKLTAVQY